MARAIIKGYLRNGGDAGTITVIEPDAEQRERLIGEFCVSAYPTPNENIAPAVVVWAVKPQLLKEVTESVASRWHSALHISIAAGVRLSSFSNWVHSNRVLRAMPNTAAMVGSGVTGLLPGEATVTLDRQTAELIFKGVGKVYWLTSDDEMNSLTALSGSGPAYVFYFLEGLQRAAVDLGFAPSLAHELILDTVQGALLQAKDSSASFAELQQQVTSKAGTTEAALRVMDEARLQDILLSAIRKAHARAYEMASEFC